MERYAQSQTVLDDNNVLILGGSGGPSFYYADAWVLNMVGDIWKWIPVEVRNSEDAPSNLWCNPVCKVYFHYLKIIFQSNWNQKLFRL